MVITKLKVALLLCLVGIWVVPTKSAMAGDIPFLGEIRYFAGNFNPRGWANCDGTLLAVSQHDALFSLLGTTYGGDGRTTFALPDLRGRVAISAGSGPGLVPRTLGHKMGQESVVLTSSQMPSHSHSFNASQDNASSTSPSGKALAFSEIYKDVAPGNTLSAATLTNATGAGHPIPLTMPTETARCIIALVGIYPSRT